ncbi:PIG-L family deacetylase [Flagellimonas aequoris]|uniref:LmbE family protein n=1 Tax=Flagellimonas aequoris TaxID=2306997 RepID=A0A418N5F2_9FLAO|nr:PIG-L family deacetylase [Allomuricauda aequoris]RIV68923.1 LmbE family protein [Allomuricauda aequoris]TXK00630.1 LmbE family protein [Allomuricauda aequoris]
MKHFWVHFLFILLISFNSFAQKPDKPTTSEIYHHLQKLNFLGTALYVAAHPDDENTNLISYLSNHEHAHTVYLSMTRGDGGQNLIGSELRELLGVLRTEELLAARNIDGGEQRFTRANDFGFSKHPNETLKIWDKDKVLSDMVWAIRNIKPDVIINRFDHRTPGSTHGHHTSSAILSMEAFDLANDASAYPEQLKSTSLWQPKRVFFNTSWWFYGSQENFEKADKSNLVKMDVGAYYPDLGLSNNEIAAMARSQHLCQGFGRLTDRGSSDEYVEFLKGDKPTNNDLFAGINTTWSRVKGGEAVGEILYKVQDNFDFRDPSKHLPDLVKAYQLLQKVEDDHWRTLKSEELKNLILECAGLYLEASSESGTTTPGSAAKIRIETINRSAQNITLKEIDIIGASSKLTPNTALSNNEEKNFEISFTVPENTNYTSPYWLNEVGTLGTYTVNDQSLIGKPETPAAFVARFVLNLAGTDIAFDKPVVHRFSKPDKGELYEPFAVLPEATSKIDEKVLIFATDATKDIQVKVRAGKDDVAGKVALDHPTGWTVTPANIPFNIPQKGQEVTVTFKVTPPHTDSEGKISPVITIGNKKYGKELVEINYDHIPRQSILLPSEAKVVRMDIQKSGEHIAYIMGAGDMVPESLEQIGYQVHIIDPNDIQKGSLDKYDAVVVGIRAYNVVEALKFKQPLLFEYVKNGGTMIVQYNTAGRWASQFENIAPYDLTLSNDRVTDENSEVKIVAPGNALMNYPNNIQKSDFDGWVQERGLYFPKAWSSEFIPVISMGDEGESPSEGSLLVAPYGEGHYIYTGLSFFRELPAGVSGAYKLFANMLSVGKSEVKKESNVKG